MTVYKRGQFWYTDFYHKGKRVRKRIPTTRKDVAVQYEADFRVKLLRGEMGLEEPDLPLDELVFRYLDFSQTNNSPATAKRDELSLRTFREHSAVKMASEITPLLVEDYKSKRAKSVSPRTVNIEIKTVKAMLNKAVEWGLLKNNPVASARLLRHTSKKVPRFLSKEEVRALLNAATDTYRPIIFAFLKTGLRLNELVNLEWEDIDLENAQLRVVNKEDKRYHPKGRRERSVPIPRDLLPVLAGLKGSVASDCVFATKEGRPRRNNILKNVKTAALRAGLTDMNVHTLRHTFASHLVMAGVDLTTVQKLLGHSSITTTMIYAHLAPDHLKAAVEKLDYGVEPEKGAGEG